MSAADGKPYQHGSHAGPPTGQHYATPPKRDDGSLDKELIREMFMASPHVAWTPFAKSQGWHAQQTMQQFPTSTWADEKKKVLAMQQAEELADLVFNHRGRWHRDVLQALRDYPAACDKMLGVLMYRLNQHITTINADIDAQKQHAAAQGTGIRGLSHGPRQAFNDVKTSELLALQMAIKGLQETKYNSLLISQWNVRVAEEFCTPQGVMDADDRAQDASSREWTLELIGGERLKTADVQRLLTDYYDPPQVQADPPAVVPAADPAEALTAAGSA